MTTLLAILWWYLAPSLIGWLCFPLTGRLFHNLPTRGYAFSRGLGLLIWGIIFWFFSAVGVLGYDLLGQSLVLGVLVIFSIYLGIKWGFRELRHWLARRWRMVLICEVVFLTAFLVFAVFRSTSPEIVDTEKPMELAFLNAILRSDSLPPDDPWLSGYAISYYYFGYFLVAMLTRLTGTASAIAYNLAQVLWFALVAVSAFGLLVDLFAIWKKRETEGSDRIQGWMLRWALLAPVLILLLGNAYGFLDVLHARGVLWQGEGDAVKSSFWSWLDLRGLDEASSTPYQWIPQRSGSVVWWNASRVVQDVDYDGTEVEVIDEFPNFSFVLGDLHPHVLAMPFVLLSVCLALDVFDAPDEKDFRFGKLKLPCHPGRFLLASVLIGSLAVLNTWDWPVYAALYSAVFVVRRALRVGWQWKALTQFMVHGLCMALTGGLAYLPFFLSFSSQASGFLPSLIYATEGTQFWVMFGPLLVPVGLYLFWIFRKNRTDCRLRKSFLLVGGLVLLLVLVNVLFSSTAVYLSDLGELFMDNLGASQASLGEVLLEAVLRRLSSPGTWLTLGALLILCLGMILMDRRKSSHAVNPIHVFIVLLVLWGGLLAFIPEFVYLLDSFGTRMNTIFKFYFQSWILWSLAGAFGAALLWRKAKVSRKHLNRIILVVTIVLTAALVLFTVAAPSGSASSDETAFGAYRQDWLWLVWGTVVISGGVYLILGRRWYWLFRVVLVVCLGVGAFYPVIAVTARADGFSDREGWTLDGSDYYRETYPDLMAAVDWLWEAESGVLVEAVASDGGDYSIYGRVSMLTGLPAVLGWQFHEVQWRGGTDEIGSRPEDIALLYETDDWGTAQGIIDKYNIVYIYLGDLEWTTYSVQEMKFVQNLTLAFQQGDVVIYQVAAE